MKVLPFVISPCYSVSCKVCTDHSHSRGSKELSVKSEKPLRAVAPGQV